MNARMSVRETHRQVNDFAMLEGKHKEVNDEKGWLETPWVATARGKLKGTGYQEIRQKYSGNLFTRSPMGDKNLGVLSG